MLVSFVTAACNAGPMLLDTIESATRSLQRVNHEIIVVDDVSTDGSCNNLPSPVRLIKTTERLGCSGARSIGCTSARGDVIILSDPHCFFPGDSLAKLAKQSLAEGAIVQPPVEVNLKPTTYGSKIILNRRGFRLGRMNKRKPSPSLIGSIYSMGRDTYKRLLEMPVMPGWWTGWEIFYSLLAYRLGLDVVVASTDICIHRSYRETNELPYDLPKHHRSFNDHWAIQACLSNAYANGLGRFLDKVSPLPTYVEFPREACVNLARTITDKSRRSEQWVLDHVLGLHKGVDDPRILELSR